MNTAYENLSLAFFISGICIFVWFLFYKALYPHDKANTAHVLGIKWLTYALLIPILGILSDVIRNPNYETAIALFAAAIASSITGYISGFMFFYIRKIFVSSKDVIQSEYNNRLNIRNVINDNNDLYVKALEEIDSSTYDKALWAKAIVRSNGDVEKCKSIYIKDRVNFLNEQMKDNHVVTEINNKSFSKKNDIYTLISITIIFSLIFIFFQPKKIDDTLEPSIDKQSFSNEKEESIQLKKKMKYEFDYVLFEKCAHQISLLSRYPNSVNITVPSGTSPYQGGFAIDTSYGYLITRIQVQSTIYSTSYEFDCYVDYYGNVIDIQRS